MGTIQNTEGMPVRKPKTEDMLSNVVKWLLKIIVPPLGVLLSALFPESTIHKFAQVLTQEQWLRITIASLGTLLMAVSYIGYLLWKQSKKPNFEDYIFDPLDQCWRHKTKEEWICASCKADNVFSPLAFDDDSGMFCPMCGKTAKNFKLKTMLSMNKLSPSVRLENFAMEKRDASQLLKDHPTNASNVVKKTLNNSNI
ncbi:MAG: hypothetical protein ACOYL3_19040 [Desulfuromonadaceae bacterium]